MADQGTRVRADSWGDDSNQGLRTEHDLHSRFEGPGFNSQAVTFKEVLHEDVATVKQFVSSKVHSITKQAGNVNSIGDVANFVTSPFPVVNTIRNYKLSYVSFDAAAGLVEGFLKVPSGLAYALLAGLPAQYGL
jgi:Sulfate permease family